MKKKQIILLILAGLVIGVCYVFFHYGEKILSKNKPINANILIIEGWLPTYALEMIPQRVDISTYETVIVTGQVFSTQIVQFNSGFFEKSRDIEIASGGAYLKGNGIAQVHDTDTIKSIRIYSYGTRAMGKYPHFLIYLNDSCIGGAYTSSVNKIPNVFNVRYPSHLLKRFLIYFDNDVEYNGEDRNLYIDSIKINNKVFAGTKFFSRFDEFQANNFLSLKSNAIKSARFLKNLGIRKSLVVLDTVYLGRNRTRAFACNCKNWIEKAYQGKSFSVNVVSINCHSRRTYETYKSLLKGKKVGVISMPFYNNGTPLMKESKWDACNYLLKEYVSLILNFFY